MLNMDPHDVLGVRYGATTDEIKVAFRKLAHLHHPDKKGGDAEKFKRITQAYAMLTKPQPVQHVVRHATVTVQYGSGGWGEFGDGTSWTFTSF